MPQLLWIRNWLIAGHSRVQWRRWPSPGRASTLLQAVQTNRFVNNKIDFFFFFFFLNPFLCFFGSEGHVALDRNPGTGYDTLLLRMIQGDLLSAFPHRQFHTLPGLLDSWAALPNSYPNACMPMQGGSLYHFYDGLWYDPAERRTHDLPCERRTRYRLSQPDIFPSFSSNVTIKQDAKQPSSILKILWAPVWLIDIM